MRRWITVILDKQRRLKYTFESIRELNELLKGDIDSLRANFFEFESLAPRSWAALVWEDPDLTPEKTKNILKEHCVSLDSRARLNIALDKALKIYRKELKKTEKIGKKAFGPSLTTVRKRK